MATGDNLGPKRPRYQANERFDVGDADAASRAPGEHLDSFQRALVTTPRAAGGALLPGMIVSGFSLTPNPVAADGKVRINAETGIAIDANGRFIIKPNTVTVDVVIPAGGPYQLYVYWQESPTDVATRRFLTVQAPFTEFPDAIPTAFQATYGTHVRSGDGTTTVKEDIINGVITPLVCIAIITSNTAGTITIAGYNAVTAPNGTAVTNRMSTVVAPSVVPSAAPVRSGSPQTMHDLVNAHAYMRGRQAFLGAKTTLTAYTGSTSAVGVNSLTDGTKTWATNELAGMVVKDFANAYHPIVSNTGTVLTLSSGLTPTAGAYVIYGPVAGNNYGAYSQPSRSLQAMNDKWDDFFDANGNLTQPDGAWIQQSSTGGYRFSGIATNEIPVGWGARFAAGTVGFSPDAGANPRTIITGATDANGVFFPLIHGLPDYAYLDDIEIECWAAPGATVRLRIYGGRGTWSYFGMSFNGDGAETNFVFPFDAPMAGVEPFYLQVHISDGASCTLSGMARFNWHVE